MREGHAAAIQRIRSVKIVCETGWVRWGFEFNTWMVGAQGKGSMGRKGDRVQLVGKKKGGERERKQNEMRGLLSNLCSCVKAVW